jgi:protein transport protein SEC13
MATTAAMSFDPGHRDVVHDVQFDYYGKRVATASSDRTVKIFEVVGSEQKLLADLSGHEGPVWQVAWAHPKFGNLLASCSFDQRVLIWKEVSEGNWSVLYQTPAGLHTASINSVTFAPQEVGLVLAAASSDGSISVLSYDANAGTWKTEKIANAHSLGCLSVSWAPAFQAGAMVQPSSAPLQPTKSLVSCGCDNVLKVWSYSEAHQKWMQQGADLTGHANWVRDVAWAPNMGMPRTTIASASEDGRVFIWSQVSNSANNWQSKLLKDFGCPVWRVSWSISGGILAVSDGNNNVSLWKEAVDGNWEQISQ